MACTQFNVPNVRVCADKGRFGAVCAYTRDDKKTKILMDKVAWDSVRTGQFCMDGKSFAQYQKFIEQVCAQEQKCVDQINDFVSRLNRP